MTPEEARQHIDEVMEKRGRARGGAKAAASVAEAQEIYERDQIERFGPTLDFLAGKTGIEAWTLRSKMELSWGGMQILISKVLEELVERRNLEISVVESKSGPERNEDQAERERNEKLRASIAETNRTIRALKVLGNGHVEAGGELAQAVVDRRPDAAGGYLLRAHYHRLKRQWTDVDDALRRAEAIGGEDDVYAKMLRAMEKLDRFDSKAVARDEIELIRQEFPEFVRAQSILAIIQDDIEATREEMEKLRSLSPHHPVILVAGPELQGEYETARELRTNQ
jgi:hypothetical protein